MTEGEKEEIEVANLQVNEEKEEVKEEVEDDKEEAQEIKEKNTKVKDESTETNKENQEINEEKKVANSGFSKSAVATSLLVTVATMLGAIKFIVFRKR